MDPTVALAHIREQLDLAERAPSPARANVHHERACEAMRGLDAFISSGGFLPNQWTEAQRKALENTRTSGGVAPPAQRTTPTTCEKSTLAGTTIPVPCPPPGDTVDEVSDLLEPDPWRDRLPELTRQQRLLAEHRRREGY